VLTAACSALGSIFVSVVVVVVGFASTTLDSAFTSTLASDLEEVGAAAGVTLVLVAAVLVVGAATVRDDPLAARNRFENPAKAV